MKSNLPQDRVAVPGLIEEPAKPMKVPELIMSELSEKKEKIEKPEELKPEIKPPMMESSESKEPEKKEEMKPVL